MSISVTLLDSGAAGFSSLGTTFTTASVSPGADCALVLLTTGINYVGGQTFASGSVTSSGSGPTWSAADYSGTSATTYTAESDVFLVEIGGTSPGSFTVTYTANSGYTIGSYNYALYKLTGYDTTTPIAGGGAAGNSAGDGAVTLTQDATPASAAVTVALNGADVDSGGDSTFGTGTGTWSGDTELSATNWSGNTGYRTGYSTDADVDWSDVNQGSGNYSSAQAVLTVNAAAGGGGFDGSYITTTAGKRRVRDASGDKASIRDASGDRWEA